MKIETYLAGLTGLTPFALFVGPPPLVVVSDHGDGKLVIDEWHVPNVPQPSQADLDAAMAEPEPPEPVIVPESVSSAQAKIQLSRTPGAENGKTMLDDVTAAVKEAGIEAQIWFAEARTWERHNPYVLTLSNGLNLTAAQVDALFVDAAKIAA